MKVITWGLKPRIVTGDSWYSSVANLKFLKNQKLGFLFGVEKNRTVSSEPGKYQQVRALSIPDEGLIIHLKEFGFIKLLRKDFKKRRLSTLYSILTRFRQTGKHFAKGIYLTIHDTHWKIETFHRAIKQLCGVCRFMVRNTHAIQTHIFCSLQAFIRLEKMRSTHSISNWYQLQRNLFTLVIREYTPFPPKD